MRNNNIIPQNEKKVNEYGYEYEVLKKDITLNYMDYARSTIPHDLITKIILNTFKIKYETYMLNGNRIYKYYKYNPEKNIFKDYNLFDLSKDINLIVVALESKNKDIKKLSEQVLYFINSGDHDFNKIELINLAPNYLIKFNNGIYNKKEMTFISKSSDDYKKITSQYDFVKMFDFDYLETLTDDNQYILVYNKLIKDLANNKDDQILLFNQLVSAVIEGNGRGKYIMLSGQAGSGKTTFGNVLLNIAGDDYTRYITMDSFDDDNSLNTLNMSTKLVLGDDLQKSAKLIGKSLRYFKTLVDGNKLSVSVKYEPNRVIQTNAVWLQMMNDDPSIYEANDAIKDRTVLVRIEGRNHRILKEPGEKEFSRRLDLYTGKTGKADENFIQAVVSYILNTVDYFDEFTISEEMRKATEDMVDDANWAYQFTEWLKENEIFEFDELPFCDINEIFSYWLSEYNTGMRKPAARNILKELNSYFMENNYNLSEKPIRISDKNLIKYNRQIIKSLFPSLKYNLNNPRSRIWIKKEPAITEIDVKNFEINFDSSLQFKNYDEFTMKEKIICQALKNIGNIDIITWCLQFESDK